MILSLTDIQQRLAKAGSAAAAREHIRRIPYYLLNNHSREVLVLSEVELARARRAGDEEAQAYCLKVAGFCKFRLHRYVESESDWQAALQLFHDHGLELAEAETLRLLGGYYRGRSRFRQSMESFRQSIVIAARHSDADLLVMAYCGLAKLFLSYSDITAAMEYFQKVVGWLPETTELHTRRFYNYSYGNLYNNLHEPRRALDFLQRSLDLHDRDPDSYLYIHIRLAQIIALVELDIKDANYFDLDEYLKQLTELDISIAATQHVYLKSSVAMCCGLFCSKAGDYQQALSYYFRSEALMRQIGENGRFTASLYCDIGRIYLKLEQNRKAIDYLERASQHGSQDDEQTSGYHAYGLLADAYERVGNVAGALRCHKEISRRTDRLIAAERERAIAALQLKYDIDRMQRELEQHKKQSLHYRHELEHRTKEAATSALSLVRKNHLLEELEARIQAEIRDGAPSRGLVSSLLCQLKDARHADQEWQSFEKQFRLLHPDFLPTLATLCRALSPSELRICSLLRLNLTSKDIAKLNSTTTRSIETMRYRIRKKLNLAHDMNLTRFLMNLSAVAGKGPEDTQNRSRHTIDLPRTGTKGDSLNQF